MKINGTRSTPLRTCFMLSMEAAVLASLRSPCQSKRGVAIFTPTGLISTGYNHQPMNFICDGSDRCKSTCGKTAIHAEQHAILSAPRLEIFGAHMLHVKTVDGIPVASAGPSCLECSKLILDAGIETMWLLLDDGWNSYSAEQFHLETLSSFHKTAR